MKILFENNKIIIITKNFLSKISHLILDFFSLFFIISDKNNEIRIIDFKMDTKK